MGYEIKYLDSSLADMMIIKSYKRRSLYSLWRKFMSSDYYQIDRERWAHMTINEQMGNISSEVGRAIIAHRNGNKAREERAINRAIDLFSATVEVLVGTKYSYRLKEVLRAREEFLRLFFDGTFETDAESIERYFMNYAFAARYEHKQTSAELVTR